MRSISPLLLLKRCNTMFLCWAAFVMLAMIDISPLQQQAEVNQPQFAVADHEKAVAKRSTRGALYEQIQMIS